MGQIKAIDEMILYIQSKGPKPFIYHLDVEICNAKCPITWNQKLF